MIKSLIGFGIFFGVFCASVQAGNFSTWSIEIQTKNHGRNVKEVWKVETDPLNKHVDLFLSDGRSIPVSLGGAEFDQLAYEIGPLSVQKKNFLELGICAQYVRVSSEFGSRKFCRKQFRKNKKLAELLSQLEVYRRRAIR